MDKFRFGYTDIVSNFLFPLHEAVEGHKSVSVLKTLEYSQWWNAEQLNEL
jgi:phenylacetate-CoA ligase